MQTAGGVHLAAHSLQVGAPTLPQALRVRMVFGEMSCLTPFREYREQRPKLHEIASWHVAHEISRHGRTAVQSTSE